MTTDPHGHRTPVAPAGPTVVGDYTLLARIGEGGMGVVHLARRSDGERVALKMLRPQVVGDDEARHRLAREVTSLERVHSLWVAEILDADPWAEIPYIATRYVPGLSLHEHVETEGLVTGADLLWLAGGLAEGLAAVHAVGVTHRDVKPSNVLMEGRRPILIDFGLARVADDPRLTHAGWLLGTPGYLAPEILYGDDATPASDVHSWAATVAFAGCGRGPFGGGPSMAIMDRVRRGQHDLSGLSGPLRDVVSAALDPDPARRPSLQGILAWLRPQTTRPHPVLVAPPTEVSARTEPVDDYTLPLAIAASALAPSPTRVLPGGEDLTVTERAPLPPPAAPPYAAPAPYPWPEGWPLPAEPVKVPAAERLRRVTLLTSGALLVAALLTLAPWVTLAVVVVAAWLLRSGSLAVEAVGHRRRLRGRKWYDGVLLLSHTPWRLVQAIPGALVLVLWSAGLAAAAALLCYALSTGAGTTLAVSGLVLVLALWWGPGGNRLRGPVGRVAHPAARTAGWWMLVTGALLVAAIAVALVVESRGTIWTPAQHPPLSSVLH